VPALDAFKLPDFVLHIARFERPRQAQLSGPPYLSGRREQAPNSLAYHGIPSLRRREALRDPWYPRTIATGLLLLLRPSCTPVHGKGSDASAEHTSRKLVTGRLRAVLELDRVSPVNKALSAAATS